MKKLLLLCTLFDYCWYCFTDPHPQVFGRYFESCSSATMPCFPFSSVSLGVHHCHCYQLCTRFGRYTHFVGPHGVFGGSCGGQHWCPPFFRRPGRFWPYGTGHRPIGVEGPSVVSSGCVGRVVPWRGPTGAIHQAARCAVPRHHGRGGAGGSGV